ncbi:hypothetical protein Tco_1223890 [Tanacetum coccineum]
MCTRSSSHLIVESSTTLKRRNRRCSKQRVEPFSLEETSLVTMADQRTMAELLQEPTEGYGDAIVTPAILAENFELKHGLLNLFKETFSEAWDRFKDLLRAYPHHGFTELHQLDTFYNALNLTDQDSLNAIAGGNLLNKTPRDALTIIENNSYCSYWQYKVPTGSTQFLLVVKFSLPGLLESPGLMESIK